MADEKELNQRIQRIEELIGEMETVSDPVIRANARELVQSLMDLHGAGIERMLETIAEEGERGMKIIDNLAEDKLVASLLLLYGLHPLALEARIAQALHKVRPYLMALGGNVELIGVHEGVLRLRLFGGGSGRDSSAKALTAAIREAIYEAAPDLTELQIERSEQQSPAGLVQLMGRMVSLGQDAGNGRR